MIASRLGLAIASAIAVLLAIVMGLDLARDDTAPTSRVLVDNFDTELLTRLEWSRGGEAAIVLERTPKGWRWSKPIAGVPANATTIDAAIAALRGARWHRRADLARAGKLRIALTATANRSVKVGIGQPLEGAGQTWVAIGDRAFLVDDWVVRALAPEPLALRETRPLRDAAFAKTIVIDRLEPRFSARIEGVRMVRPIELRMHPNVIAPLHRALSELTIQSLPEGPVQALEMTISIDTPPLVTVEVYQVGCKDGVAIGGTLGTGCISQRDLGAIQQALVQLRSPSTILADQVPARIDPVRIELPDTGILDLEKRPRIGDRDADPARVAELLAVLQTSVDVEDSDPESKPIAMLEITDRSGETIELELLPKSRVRRKAEPVTLVVGSGAWDILRRPVSAYFDPTLWAEDELTIQSITIDDKTFTRGAVVGEWTGGDAAALSELARLLAKPRGTPTTRAAVTHTITFTTAPPSGAPITRTLQVSATCGALVNDWAVQLDAAICKTLARLL